MSLYRYQYRFSMCLCSVPETEWTSDPKISQTHFTTNHTWRGVRVFWIRTKQRNVLWRTECFVCLVCMYVCMYVCMGLCYYCIGERRWAFFCSANFLYLYMAWGLPSIWDSCPPIFYWKLIFPCSSSVFYRNDYLLMSLYSYHNHIVLENSS